MADLRTLFESENISLTDLQVTLFNKYTELLLKYNQVMNLTAITDPSEINLKHYLDSILPVSLNLIGNNTKIIDVGCGAGFPSLPIKIIRPDTDFTLLDSLGKRVNFLNEVISELNLNGIEAIHKRAEDAGRDELLREKFDICVARAVAPLNILLEYCTPFIKPNGIFIALKGKEVEDELNNAKNAAGVLSVKHIDTIHKILSGTDNERNIIIYKKIKHTDIRYPRQAGKPSKKPL